MKKLLEKLPFYDWLVLPWHAFWGLFWALRYGFPARRLTVIGVTGTNGKTTTSFLIWQMLRTAGRKTGLLTTVGWGVDKLRQQIEHMTTESPRILNQRLRELKRSGATHVVLEATSHALAQYRLFGVPVEIAVLTNVTHEHLDYHRNFARYRAAKLKLFQRARMGVVNHDDPSAEQFLAAVAEGLDYGIRGGELRAEAIKLRPEGVEYRVVSDRASLVSRLPEGLLIKTHLPGQFNVYNSLAAVAVGLELGLSPTQVAAGIAALKSVEGRMNRIDEGQNFTVIMDYAHTPDAFEKLLPDMKEATGHGRLIVLFGSAGGRRDPSKRQPMGEIAGRYADIVVLTEEDDRDTDGELILEQIAVGARQAGKQDGVNLYKELQRPAAIRRAVSLARRGDIVLFLGKGNEKTIERADGAHPYSEEHEIRQVLIHPSRRLAS